MRCGTIIHSAKNTRQQKQWGKGEGVGGKLKKDEVSNIWGSSYNRGVRNPLPTMTNIEYGSSDVFLVLGMCSEQEYTFPGIFQKFCLFVHETYF